MFFDFILKRGFKIYMILNLISNRGHCQHICSISENSRCGSREVILDSIILFGFQKIKSRKLVEDVHKFHI